MSTCSICRVEIIDSRAAYMDGCQICPTCACLVMTTAAQTSVHAHHLMGQVMCSVSATIEAMKDADETYRQAIERHLRRIDCNESPADQATELRRRCGK